MTEIQQQLITDHIRLVHHITWKLRKTDFVSRNRDDLNSEGMVGLIKAARAFDPAKGVKFATFASACIRNEMLMYIRRNKKFETDLSLFTVIGGDPEGNELLLMDVICEEETNIERAERAANAADDLHDLAALLSEWENKIVGCLYEDMMQKEIAEELGVSRSYVSRFIRNIRSKYKKMIKRYDCG